MIEWWMKRKEVRQARKAARQKAMEDEYFVRLTNSVDGLTGTQHSGSGPFLEIYEIRALIRDEMDRHGEYLSEEPSHD